MDFGIDGLNVGAALWSVAVTVEIVIRITMIGIVPGNRRPTTAMAWLLAIFFIPVVGLALYLLFANTRLSRRRIQRQKRVNESILETTQHMIGDQVVPDAPDWVLSAVALNKALGALPLQEGNAVEFITGYGESFDQMRREIDRAQRYVHVQFYIMGDDETYVGPILEALERAVDRGVKVRVLFDHLGTIRVKGYLALTRRMTGAGIHWRRMLPLAPVPTPVAAPRPAQPPQDRGRRRARGLHRQPEPDRARATSGVPPAAPAANGSNSWPSSTGRWSPAWTWSLPPTGPQESDEDLLQDLAGVETIHPARRPNAGEAIGQLVPSGPGFEAENNLRLFNTLIYSATERLSITSPYFVPDDSLLYAITTAAQRGVAVELFVCEKGDQFLVHRAQQSYYEVLLKAGVRIYRYRAPMVLHSKCFAVDDEVAVLGSSNMDMRSFSLNLEITLMLLGPDMVAELMRVQDSYRAESVELTLDEWKSRKPLSRWIDNVARLSATLQ